MNKPLALFRFRHGLLLIIATLASAPRAQAQVGVFGNALLFDGTNQYISVTNFGAIAPTNEVTVEFWAYANAIAQQAAFMLQPDDSNNRFNAHISFNNANTYWDFGNIGAGGRLSEPNPPGTISNWTHYAFVASFNSNSMSIYVNGVLSTSKAGMSRFVRGNYDLRIGGNISGGADYFFNGQLDEFRVWNTARTASQILSNFNRTLTGGETNLLLYYRFDTASGTVATNSATATGVNYNSTLVNAPVWTASTIPSTIVTTTNDSGPGSLRQALSDAATIPGADTVAFAPGLSGQTITLASQITVNDTNGVTIDATNLPSGITIRGGGQSGSFRLFSITNSTSFALRGLTLADGGGTNFHADGGAIFNSGTLTLTRCTLFGNSASNGGAIFGSGTLLQCTLASNTASANGGAINVSGTAVLTHCTVSSNSANSGGGIFKSGTLTLTNSIVAGNTASTSSNIAGTFTGPNNVTTGNPLLAPLGDYGGPTKTMALLPGSPARNAAAGSLVTSDQRGFPIVGTRDVGAYEAGTLLNYTTWLWETFPANATLAQRAASFDFDGDGRLNAIEYATLTDPLLTNAGPALVFTRNIPRTIATNRFSIRAGATDLLYQLARGVTATNVTNIVEVNTATRVTNSYGPGLTLSSSGNTLTVTDTNIAGRSLLFYKLKVQLTP
jgi:hypothetical protein